MKILEQTKTQNGNNIELIGEPAQNPVLIIGVFHGDEPQGKFLIDKYILPCRGRLSYVKSDGAHIRLFLTYIILTKLKNCSGKNFKKGAIPHNSPA